MHRQSINPLLQKLAYQSNHVVLFMLVAKFMRRVEAQHIIETLHLSPSQYCLTLACTDFKKYNEK